MGDPMLDDGQLEIYLDRLGYFERPLANREALDELIFRHQKAVPFCTVDIARGSGAPDLSMDAVFDKVVKRHRGGYCFEINKVFEALLESLGYDSRAILSRAVRGERRRMPINHRAVIVSLDGPYFCDVGFGGPMPAGALKLEDGVEQEIRGEVFIAQRKDESWWNIDRITRASRDSYDDDKPAKRQTELEICMAKVEDIDFDALSLACSRPGVLFRESELANLRTDSGYRAYKDGVLTIGENGKKTITELSGKNEIDEALKTHFGI